jgi:dihydrofolate reductase
MSKLRFTITTSLDGYVAGPNQSLEQPLGEGGEALHDWVTGLQYFHEMHGMEGGTTGPDNDVIRESFANIGAWIMGRGMFGGGPGPWKDDWKGWWGDNPPYHCPAYVLTHHPREPLEMEGGTTFYFVTDGIESALRQAKESAGGQDVLLGGGADVANQYLAAGLIDEIELHVAPRLLGGGARLFADLGPTLPGLELVRTLPGNGVTHIKYRVLR